MKNEEKKKREENEHEPTSVPKVHSSEEPSKFSTHKKKTAKKKQRTKTKTKTKTENRMTNHNSLTHVSN